ncbi:MAG: hypothetical protein IPO95_10400 [Rhodanobacteraceae bacterium]|jgi:hypothetical protein|nr:hypothetical protein [Rhodanobacteraceae bacterium]MBL0041829.1 hypothetical protein [Xanthomonadales bacterium]MBP6079255.1 hypothetical protein [Xanthomonadales bacterium]MBP7623111.1 hypothetical protein [Xanthomonadales bacterium]
MAYLVGIILAILVAAFARCVGLDRDRAFYPTVLVVVASYYDLYAVIGGSMSVLAAELAVTCIFLAVVVVGFKRDLRIVAAGLVGHGLFDLVHGHLIDNPGLPAFWPAFCMSYDLVAGGLLFWMLRPHRPMRASSRGSSRNGAREPGVAAR